MLKSSWARTIDLAALVDRNHLFAVITALPCQLCLYFIEMHLALLTSGPKRASRCEHHQELARGRGTFNWSHLTNPNRPAPICSASARPSLESRASLSHCLTSSNPQPQAANSQPLTGQVNASQALKTQNNYSYSGRICFQFH